MAILLLYDIDGNRLGTANLDAVPREGEAIRLTKTVQAGDYIVRYVRWDVIANQVILGLERTQVDTWPDAMTAPTFSGANNPPKVPKIAPYSLAPDSVHKAARSSTQVTEATDSTEAGSKPKLNRTRTPKTD